MTSHTLRDPDHIRVAVLGAGRMGEVHLRNVAAIPFIDVTVVADPSPEAAAKGSAIARAGRTSPD
ncbi:MAG TPA: hypothetical protein VEG29_04135, partial [Candidatus Binatia bacterium]|nr:hypothetical protein [Candidatus Binatia bacterium]